MAEYSTSSLQADDTDFALVTICAILHFGAWSDLHVFPFLRFIEPHGYQKYSELIFVV